MFLSPANDFHGRIGDLPAAIEEIKSREWRVTCSPHHNHQDTASYEVATQLWFDQHLKNTFAMPVTPESTLQLQTLDGVPTFSVQPDLSKTVVSVDIFYTQHGKPGERPEDRVNTMHRFWHHAKAIESNGRWTAKLPLSSTAKPLWVYANVHYSLEAPVSGVGYYYGAYTANSFNLSSLLRTASPDELRTANVEATMQPSLMIESFEAGWESEWFTYKPYEWARATHKIRDDAFAAPEHASLAIEVLSEQSNALVVLIDENAAVVQLNGGDQWQEIVLTAQEFLNFDGDGLANFKEAMRLILSPSERLKPARGSKKNPQIVGEKWRGAKPQFRNLRWMPNSLVN